MTSQDIKFVGDIRISVIHFKSGYGVYRSDKPDVAYLNPNTQLPYVSHTEAIKGVQRMAELIIEDSLRRHYRTQQEKLANKNIKNETSII